MANTTKKTEANPFDRFASDDRANNAKQRGLMNIKPPRKNRKDPTVQKGKK